MKSEHWKITLGMGDTCDIPCPREKGNYSIAYIENSHSEKWLCVYDASNNVVAHEVCEPNSSDCCVIWQCNKSQNYCVAITNMGKDDKFDAYVKCQ